MRSYAFLPAGLLGLLTMGARAGETKLPPLPVTAIPAVSDSGRYADPETSPALRQIDALVKPHGITQDYWRRVEYWPESLQDFRPEAREATKERFAVVNYGQGKDFDEMGSGVLVWIERPTGAALVVPKKLVRAAFARAVAEGVDLTHYNWGVHRVADRFGKPEVLEIRFWVRPAPAVSLIDGSFAICVDPKTGKVLNRKLRWN